MAVLFIVILTTVCKVTSLHCSDQQLPAASGDDHLQQVTTLQYCLIDNCTILVIDTGEKLDIVYTTDSLIVTTPTDGHTSAIIGRLEMEPYCVSANTLSADYIAFIVIWVGTSVLLVLVDGYIILVHLMFKELRNLFGKLLMLSSLAVVCVSITTIILMPILTMEMHTACQYVTVLSLYQGISVEVFAACILHLIAYTMHCTYKLRPPISEAKSKVFFRRYISCWVSMMLVVLLLMICHDMISMNGFYILPDNDCGYTTKIVFVLSMMCNSPLKAAQIVMFMLYLYYKYKLSKTTRVHDVEGAAKRLNQQRQLNTIAIAMGATIGISQLAFWLFIIFSLPLTVLGVTFAIFLMQQCIIMTNFMCTEKMKGLCKEYFSKE